jgi:hypothetical protein
MTVVTTYRRSISETAMRDAIMAAVHHLGGRCWFVHDSRYAPAMADLPDLIIALPRGVVAFVELKSQRRAITDGQHAAIALLQGCQVVETFIVRPEPRDASETAYDAFMDWVTA